MPVTSWDAAAPAPQRRAACAAGADRVATTLAGYPEASAGCELPAFALVRAAAAYHPFVVCEGGIASPAQARTAFASGASAIVVGTAITNVDALVRRYAETAPRANRTSPEDPST
ncbi:MAG: hypothetical protein NVSMB21_00960 [Vulcanimicrobiaceae bacterium]